MRSVEYETQAVSSIEHEPRAIDSPAPLLPRLPGDVPWWSRGVDAWQRWRDRMLASPAFQRRAAGFVLTRPIARRRARALFDLVAGFVYSQVLLACVRLHLFDLLAAGPASAEALAERLALPLDSTRRLLAAAVSLRLVEPRRGGRFGLGELGAAMVGNTAVAAMIEHHGALYADITDPVGLLRGASGSGRLAAYWPYAADSESTPSGGAAALPDPTVAAYTALMAASQPLVADEVLDAYPIGRHRSLLDVGGGDGSFLCAAARRAPLLRLTLFDLPPVAERGRERLAAEGLAERSTVVGGSFLHDDLPTGSDVASLVRVIHDHDDSGAMTILRAVRKALLPNGRLLLAEPMAGTRGAESMGDAYFGFYLLAMGRGKPRTQTELKRLLELAGFVDVQAVPTRLPLQTCVLLARRHG